MVTALLLALALTFGFAAPPVARAQAGEQDAAGAPAAASGAQVPSQLKAPPADKALQPQSPNAPAASSTEPVTPPPSAASQTPSSRADEPADARREMHRWDRYVRGFRREHNFALTTGVSSGTWSVRHFGTLDDRHFNDSGVFTKFQYSYHMPLYKGFGYLLGSSAGYHYESVDKRSAFKPVPAYQFPGLLAGLVMNFNPVLRVSIAADAYLERHVGIQERDGQGDDPEIAVTMTAYDGGLFIDIFYDLSWAVRLEAHRRHLDYQSPLRREHEVFPVNAYFSKDDQWLGLGLVYHLL